MILEHWSCLLGFHHVFRLSLPLCGAVIIQKRCATGNLCCGFQFRLIYFALVNCMFWRWIVFPFFFLFGSAFDYFLGGGGGKLLDIMPFFWFSSFDQSSVWWRKNEPKRKHSLKPCRRTAVKLVTTTDIKMHHRTEQKKINNRATDLHSDENLFLTVMQTNARNGQGATRESAQTHSFQFQTIWFTYDSIDMLFVLRVCVLYGRVWSSDHACGQFRFHWTVQDIINLPRSNFNVNGF